MAELRFHEVLLDTGPLVAILNAQDDAHSACVETLERIDAPLLTCWPVLTEAAWLLRSNPVLIAKMLRGAKAGVFQLLPLDENDLDNMNS